MTASKRKSLTFKVNLVKCGIWREICLVTVSWTLEKYKFIHLTNVVQVLLNVILNIVLIPIYGMIGAAVATVIAYACKAIMFEIYFRLKIKKLFAV